MLRLDPLRTHPLGRGAQRIGVAVSDHPGRVVMQTPLGGRESSTWCPAINYRGFVESDEFAVLIDGFSEA